LFILGVWFVEVYYIFHKTITITELLVPQGQLQEFIFGDIIAAGYDGIFYNSYASLSFGILYLLYSIYGMRAKNDNIGHTAHFGGAIGGYVITLISIRI
jgi:membrane associated rhomboid family serine protease